MAFEELPSSSLDDEPTKVRSRRAAVLAGVALVWAAFMASLGLLLIALLVLVAAAVAAVWILGPRLPRPHLGFDGARRRQALEDGRRRRQPLRLDRRSPRRFGLAHGGCHDVAPSGHRSPRRRRAPLGRARRRQRCGRADGQGDPRLHAEREPAPARSTRRAGARVELPGHRAGESGQARRGNRRIRRGTRSSSPTRATVITKGGCSSTSESSTITSAATRRRRYCWNRALERLEPGTPESERTAELLGAR